MALACLPSCSREHRQAVVLRALVKNVVKPGTDLLVSEAKNLEVAVARLAKERSEAMLKQTRDVFQRVLLSWKRASVFRSDASVESGVFLRAMFWPQKPRTIDAVLTGARDIDGQLVEELGADAKGLFALEYLLFDLPGEGDAPLVPAARRHAYARAICGSITAYAERNARLFGDGSAYADTFAEGGRGSVEKLIGRTTDTLEVIVGRLARTARRHSEGMLRPMDVEGFYSGSSLAIAQALLAGAELLYVGADGGGLGDIVKSVAEPVDAHVRQSFAESRAALAAVGAPLEKAVLTNPRAVAAAESTLRKLEVTMKTEVTSALGVTVTFTGADGD